VNPYTTSPTTNSAAYNRTSARYRVVASVRDDDAAEAMARRGRSAAMTETVVDPPKSEFEVVVESAPRLPRPANPLLEKRWFRALPAALLALVAVWEIVATRKDATSVPGDEAWSRAEKIVRAAFRPGDLIVFAPGWEDPVGRMHLGDLIPIEAAARDDAKTYARIWELSTREAHAPEVDGLTLAEEKSDDVTVRRYEQQPAMVVGDLRDHVSSPGTLQLAEVGFEPHRCIQITPPAKLPAIMTAPQFVLGTELVGYVGLADVFTRRDIRAPGNLQVSINGTQVANVEVGVDDGWVRFAVKTTPGPAELRVTAYSDAPQRNICFSITGRK
jgi:hypothetical protein